MSVFFKTKTYGKIYLSSFLLLIITACNSEKVDPEKVFDTPITQENLDNMLKFAEEKATDLNIEEKNFLKELKYIQQGEKQYIHSFLQMDTKKISLRLTRQHFKNTYLKIFRMFEKNKLTLNNMFAFIKIKKEMLTLINFNEIYKKVDQHNNEIQKKIEEEEIRQGKVIEEFNKRFYANNKGIYTHNFQNFDKRFFDHNIVFTNPTREFVKNYTYTIIFTDSNGEEKYNLNFTSVVNQTTYWDQDKKGYKPPKKIIITNRYCSIADGCNKNIARAHSLVQIYLLSNSINEDPLYISIKVLKVTTDNNSYPDFGGSDISKMENKHYISPKKLRGAGPYTSTNEILSEEIAKAQVKINKYRKTLPLLKEYEYYIESLKEYNLDNPSLFGLYN